MAQPQLRISFSGLCLFDFNRRLSEETKPTQAQVLLQRLTRARSLSRMVNGQAEVLDQHFPLLDFSLANWSPASTRMADFHYLPDARGRMTRGACLLNGEDLTIHPDGNPEPTSPALQLSRSAPQDPVNPQSPEDLETLWWMATLDQVYPNNPLDPRIRETAPASNQAVLARVTLSQGSLKTKELSNSPCTVVGPGPSPFNRRVATGFELEIGCREMVEIRMTAMRNGRTTTSKLVLDVKDGADLEIGIANMEIDRYIGMDPADGPRSQGDFEIYTSFLTKPIRGLKPFLLETSPGGSSGCCGLANCFGAAH
jgi:hypothetical protein